MKVTLITICWNAAATIRRTLDSILAQKRLPDEYIFIDGGSTDGTLEILAEYQKKFCEAGVAVIIEEQHRVDGEAGIPNAWNQALRKASGDIIAMLNADDWYAPDMLSFVEAKFAEDDALEAVISPIEFVSEGKTVSAFYPQSLSKLSWKMPWPHPGCVFSKKLYDRLGLYDTRYRISADYDFLWRCHKSGVKSEFLDYPLVCMETGGLANVNRKVARCETLAIAHRHCAWCNPIPLMAYVIRVITGR